MRSASNLVNNFLIAMPSLADPNFSQTVTYLCDHTQEGAMGLVINRPLEVDFTELLEHLDMQDTRKQPGSVPIYQGGPVQTDRGFVIHEGLGNWEATLAVTDKIGVTMSQDIIEAIAHGEGPGQYMIMLGYAGWGTGQLEEELANNAWLNGPADPAILFDTPVEQRWTAAASHLGIELQNLSPDIGHA
jgi:putative transcriptional regulator